MRLSLWERSRELITRAERKAGELLGQLERSPLSNGGDTRPASQAVTPPSEYSAVLEESDINRMTAHRWQTVAQVPDEVFEEHVAEVKQEQRELTSAGLLRLASEIKQAAEAVAPTPDSYNFCYRIECQAYFVTKL